MRCLGRGHVETLKTALKQIGYSEKTAAEILKWYGANVSQEDETFERNIRPGDFRKQRR